MTTHFKIHALSACAILCALLLPSCGYHMGSMMHPQIKTIAVAPVTNDTLEPLVSAIMRQQLCEQFQVDNSLKVKQQGEADCILQCKVVEVRNDSVTWASTNNQITYRPSEMRITVIVEFTVIIPGKGEPLIKSRSVKENATYQYQSDPAIGRADGLKQACYNAARKMVEYTAEAW